MKIADPKAVLVYGDQEKAKILAETLESGGIEVQITSDVESGRAEAGTGADVIVLDLSMSGKPSELCRSFTINEQTRGIPLLAVTESSLDDTVVGEALSAGAMDVLSLDINPQLLLARIRNLILIHQEEVQIEETEKRYRRIFDSSQYGYFLSTKAGRFLEVNDSLVRMLGYSSREDVLRLKLPEDLYVNPGDRELLQNLIQKQGFVKDFKVNFKRRDGSVLTILLTGNLYRSPDGSIIGFEGVNIPLMDVKQSPLNQIKSFISSFYRRKLTRRKNYLSVSRISELVADRYEKLEELSEGRYSSVWKARDILGLEEDPLVIKVSKNAALNNRFLMEARVLTELGDHPGIPELVTVARHRGRVLLVIKFVDGAPLSEILDSLSNKERDRIVYQLLDVLSHLHRHDIVHRDIKPANIIVGTDGEVVLLDFGIVRRIEELETSPTVIGTRPFMSPEQVNGKSERRSDIWSLGVVMYRLYTGRMPFSGSTELELIENILKSEPLTPRSVNRELPASLEAIIIQTLRKRPESRFQSADELKEAMLSKLSGFRENVADLTYRQEPGS
ncbi:MAG: protein kinase [bacterium]